MPSEESREMLSMDNGFRIGPEGYKSASEPLTLDINGSDGTTIPIQYSNSSETLREKWSKNIEFLLSCVALSVGFGNVWRFPYVALQNGGGAFLIPYLIVLFVVGRPIYYLEMIVGQFSSRGCVKVFDMCPLMRGVGVGQTITMLIIVGYYAAIMAIAVRYFLDSFDPVLPWSECQPHWDCISSSLKNTNTTSNSTMPSSRLYFQKTITKMSSDLENGIGTPNWELAACLLACWIVITALLIKGIRSSGKAAYFLAIFPYVILCILMVRAVTLPGAGTGLMYFITPQLEKLLTIDIWYAAISQCFFSLTVGLGAVIVFSSFNNFSNNIYRDAMIISLLDTFTSMLSGVIVFGVVGHLSYITGKDVKDLMANGTALIFEVYPEVIAKMDYYPNAFGVLFFLMFILLGLGSNMGIVTTILTSIRDRFPNATPWKVVLGISVIGFSCGLVYISPGGLHVLDIVDYYGVTLPTLVLVLLEVITFCWFYGVNRICLDVKIMLNISTGIFWRVCWGFLSIIMLFAIFVLKIAENKKLNVPMGYKVLAYGLFSFQMLQLLGWALYGTAQQPGKKFWSKMCKALKPTDDWGPESEIYRRSYEVELRQLKNSSKSDSGLVNRFKHKFFK